MAPKANVTFIRYMTYGEVCQKYGKDEVDTAIEAGWLCGERSADGVVRYRVQEQQYVEVVHVTIQQLQ